MNPTIACIVPPHVLDRIARNGDAEQRAWALDTLLTDQSLRTQRVHELVGAAASVVMPSMAGGPPVVDRTIYDAKTGSTLPGTAVRAEGQPATSDPEVDEAYDGLGATWDLYWNAFGRDSVDGRGLPLRGTVHYQKQYDNAFWNGQQMVFGDGDGKLFTRFTVSVDVIGHELTHGVTQYTAGLAYLGQSGALNESISDVFGSLVKQHSLNQTADQADWLIGQGLLAPGVHGVALRSMKAPGTAFDDPVLGKDDQPADMAHYVHTTNDNGGVHTNSGIPNHAFYLAAVAVGGYAWEKPGRIWYDALRDPRVTARTGFRGFAGATVRAAQAAFGAAEVSAVRAAWKQVGVVV